MLRRADTNFRKLYGGRPIKFVEWVGNKIVHILNSADLRGSQACGRENCLPCGKVGGNWEGDEEEQVVDLEEGQGEVQHPEAQNLAPKLRGSHCWLESVMYRLV